MKLFSKICCVDKFIIPHCRICSIQHWKNFDLANLIRQKCMNQWNHDFGMRLISAILGAEECTYNGKVYEVGDFWRPDKCTSCQCHLENGKHPLSCESILESDSLCLFHFETRVHHPLKLSNYTFCAFQDKRNKLVPQLDAPLSLLTVNLIS